MCTENLLVSIVLPTYNRAQQLAEAIESCLEQTYTHFELLVVDDGSSDETPSVIKHYVEQDARVFYLPKENGGLPIALNYGFERAKGNLLTWTSDDNRYLPNALERMVSVREAENQPCLIYSDYWAWNTETGERKAVTHGSGDTMASRNLVGACFLYDRAVQESVGLYDPAYFLVEDYEYWLRISCRFPLVHLKEPLYLYRFHNGTLTSLRPYEIKALAWVTRFKYRQVGLMEFLKAYRKNLSRLLRSDFTTGRKITTTGLILQRSIQLILKPLPVYPPPTR